MVCAITMAGPQELLTEVFNCIGVVLTSICLLDFKKAIFNLSEPLYRQIDMFSDKAIVLQDKRGITCPTMTVS